MPAGVATQSKVRYHLYQFKKVTISAGCVMCVMPTMIGQLTQSVSRTDQPINQTTVKLPQVEFLMGSYLSGRYGSIIHVLYFKAVFG